MARTKRDSDSEAVIHWLYTNVDSPVMFANERDLVEEAKKRGISRPAVRAYLQRKSITYNLHKQSRRRFKRAPIRSAGVGTHIQVDLADMSKYKTRNSGRRFILVAWDAFSKRIYAEAMHRKRPSEVARTFKRILTQMLPNRPWYVAHDDGSEFKSDFANLLRRRLITQRLAPHSRFKMGGVERAIRSLKTRLEKYMTEYDTRRWLPALKSVVNGLNRQPKRALGGKRPVNVTNENEHLVNERERAPSRMRFRYKVGDPVRVRLDDPDVGYKGYEQRYSRTIYLVDALSRSRRVPVYKLTTLDAQPIEGIFYAEELTHG